MVTAIRSLLVALLLVCTPALAQISGTSSSPTTQPVAYLGTVFEPPCAPATTTGTIVLALGTACANPVVSANGGSPDSWQFTLSGNGTLATTGPYKPGQSFVIKVTEGQFSPFTLSVPIGWVVGGLCTSLANPVPYCTANNQLPLSGFTNGKNVLTCQVIDTTPTIWCSPVSNNITTTSAGPCVGDFNVTPASGIQNAINGTSTPKTFCLAAGTYNEAVVPKSGDVLIGAGVGQTILDGTNTLNEGISAAVGGVVIENMTVTRYVQNDIHIQASGWLVDTVEMANAGIPTCGSSCTQGIGVRVEAVDSTIIRNSLIHDAQLNGINTVNATHLTVTNNDFYNNNLSCQNPFGGTASYSGWKMNGGSNFTITNNKIHDEGHGCTLVNGAGANFQPGFGIWLDGFTDLFTIEGNEVYNQYVGMYIEVDLPQEPVTRNLIKLNYFHDNAGEQLAISSSGGITISNNAFSACVASSCSSDAGSQGTALTVFQFEEDRSCATNGTNPSGLACFTDNLSYDSNYFAYATNIALNPAPHSGQQSTNDLGGFGNWQAQNVTWTNNTYYIGCGSGSSADFVNNGTNLSNTQWKALTSTPDANSTFICGAGPNLPPGVGPRGGFVCPRGLTCP